MYGSSATTTTTTRPRPDGDLRRAEDALLATGRDAGRVPP